MLSRNRTVIKLLIKLAADLKNVIFNVNQFQFNLNGVLLNKTENVLNSKNGFFYFQQDKKQTNNKYEYNNNSFKFTEQFLVTS